MNRSLLDRSLGTLSPGAFARVHHARLLQALQWAPNVWFDGGETLMAAVVEVGGVEGDISSASAAGSGVGVQRRIWAHQAGVNALAVEQFEDRWMISGGADSSIKIWDLQKLTPSPGIQTLAPTGAVSKGSSTHTFGITHVSFYPFDADAFLSSSYDHSLKVYATEKLTPSASFNLDSIIYTHALSPIASHLLVACATQHPTIRLVDLRSGSSAHSLAGHSAAILALSWSPTHEHILASGSADGTARLWDVRKSAPTLGTLDLENSIGAPGYDGLGSGVRIRASGRAHVGAVNGLAWTDDGAFIVTAGHDAKIRVWDAATGANTLASFGPTIRNARLECVPLLVSPSFLTAPREEVLFWANEGEMLVFGLHEGRLLRRMKIPGSVGGVRSRQGERRTRERVTAMAWRGVADGFLSAHSDGVVRAWWPWVDEDEDEGGEDEPVSEEQKTKAEETARKRKALDDVYRDLTRQKITFG